MAFNRERLETLLDIDQSFLMIDKFELEGQTCGRSLYKIYPDNKFFVAHFKSAPTYPMSLLLETALQTCACHIRLAFPSSQTHSIVYSSRLRIFAALINAPAAITTVTSIQQERRGLVDISASLSSDTTLLAKVNAQYTK